MLAALMNESLTACLLWCYWLFFSLWLLKKAVWDLVYLPYHSHFYWIMKLLVHKGGKKFHPIFSFRQENFAWPWLHEIPLQPNVEKIIVHKKQADIQTLIFDINNKLEDVCVRVCYFMLKMNTLERCCSDRIPHACEEKKAECKRWLRHRLMPFGCR